MTHIPLNPIRYVGMTSSSAEPPLYSYITISVMILIFLLKLYLVVRKLTLPLNGRSRSKVWRYPEWIAIASYGLVLEVTQSSLDSLDIRQHESNKFHGKQQFIME